MFLFKFRWHDEKLTKDANGEYDIVVGKIQLIVAIPPVEVSMKMGENFITGPIKINLAEQKKASNISCVATGKYLEGWRQPVRFKNFLAEMVLWEFSFFIRNVKKLAVFEKFSNKSFVFFWKHFFVVSCLGNVAK